MLHDIGIYRCDAPSIECHGTEAYIAHGIIGARLLRNEGIDEEIARVAERHTGSGITAAEVEAQNLPIPVADYLPVTMLEKLVCYADKFFSKSGSMQLKPFDRVKASMARFGEAPLARFNTLATLFTFSIFEGDT